jgi:glycosyltransferase involved in cell wall biosynthesis
MSDNAAPLVTIMLPTHNRPDYGELALQSALAQTYRNIEIIISDNSDDEQTRLRFAPYVARYPHIRYLRAPGYSANDNGLNCFRHARGRYLNYLMDDDLYHPDKILRMMSFMLADDKVGLVTSFRQLIDAHGNHMAPIAGTERMLESEACIDGRELGRLLLNRGCNLIGEPTTVLVRRSALDNHFGIFAGRQYTVLSDVATWLTILRDHDAVYLPDALSCFRLHGGQDQRGNGQAIRANIEWLQLYCDALQSGWYFDNRHAAEEHLASKLTTCLWYLGTMREEIRHGAFDVEAIEATVGRATALLLSRPSADQGCRCTH